MRRINYRPFVFLAFFLVLFMCLPLRFTEGVRSKFVAVLNFPWQGLSLSQKRDSLEIEQLKLENQSLRGQIQNIRQWLLLEERIEEQWEKFKQLSNHEMENEAFWKQFFRRRSSHLGDFLSKQFQSVSAQVIFRQPASWSSSVWLNVGEKDNQRLGRTIVAINSPVLADSAVIGIVEYVGPSKSRVRLITDAGLKPAVRAVREGMRYMAKGELHGSSAPLWRSRGQMLKGVGFNYDYPDEEGPARDLRSPDSILKEGDLLVTSGLDGVFPPDLPVAVVTEISQLREGACSYEIQARSLCSNPDELTTVFVLPPM